MKVCIRCGVEKPLGEFYKHPQMADGHLGKCKACCRAESVANRQSKIEHYREYDRARSRAPQRVQHNTANTRRWRRQNPEKAAAHIAVRRALRSGALQKQPCEVCQSADVHAHHDDYSQPLAVRWLCPLHHAAHHQEAA